ncbi:mitochondrial import inner membrane translocase subunit tim16 [Histoplasma capsulatum var. duboisii H88]|uniref:Mitochondrial import inner membrane translocase subunit TIM16 n=1 Tax=Ajellomyces capsulatus (strain H88) TaxID=544711 RepID=F0URJ3_AJEC8|nr:mitochondrial import inner membrane translocase subunit tim16 [Histoplasma capsulatum var. duboisii H88]
MDDGAADVQSKDFRGTSYTEIVHTGLPALEQRKGLGMKLLNFFMRICGYVPQETSQIIKSRALFRKLHDMPFHLLLETCAHRIVTQIVLTGGRVFGRAFAEAYKQASAASKYAAQKGNGTAANNFASSGLTLDEACKILNVKPPMGGEANMEHTMERFKKLFDANDPKKGGSFYLQSKILRARERIEMEVRDAERKAAMEKEVKEGWKPKVYKDR